MINLYLLVFLSIVYLVVLNLLYKRQLKSTSTSVKNYIISLLRSKDRREHIQKNFIYDKEIYDAIDGKLIVKENPELTNRYFKENHKLSPGQVGVYLSHIFLWTEIAKQNEPGKRYYIFEDDVVLVDNLPTEEELPPDAEMVFLGHTAEYKGKKTKYPGYRKTVWPRGLFGYMVSTEAAQKLVDHFETIRADFPLDELLPKAIQELGIVSYSCYPAKVTATAGFISVVNN